VTGFSALRSIHFYYFKLTFNSNLRFTTIYDTVLRAACNDKPKDKTFEQLTEATNSFNLTSRDRGNLLVFSDLEDDFKSEVRAYHPKPDSTSNELKTDQVSTNTPEKTAGSNRISNNDMAHLLMEIHNFCVIDKNLHVWDPSLGHCIGLVGNKADQFIRQNTPEQYRGLVEGLKHARFRENDENQFGYYGIGLRDD
jgi:hypothetical protein